MAKFLFNLETVLKHRENIEQKERDELLRLTYKYQVELRKRDDLIFKRQETMKELAAKQIENTANQELSWFYLYLNRLSYEIAECEKRLLQLKAEVEAQKEIVIEASKKRKVLSSLKAKKEKEYVLATEKREQKEIDEWVVARFATKDPHNIDITST